MPRSKNGFIPKYRKHKGKGLAVVTINGRDIYLGKYGSASSKQQYERVIAEWLAGGSDSKRPEITIVELIRLYWAHVKNYYRKDGKPTSEVDECKQTLQLLRQLYGDTVAAEFGPLGLKVIREKMIDKGWCRGTINRRVRRLKRLFKWGVSEELVPPSVFQALATVEGLRKGRTRAKESKPVLPVSETDVEATRKKCPPTVGDMIRFQLATGCRPQEVCSIRPTDVDRSGPVWLYRPEHHKTEHHERERVIVIGPRGQAILAAYLDRPAEAYCFAPSESERLRYIDMRRRRKSRVQPSQRNRRKSAPKRPPGDRYTVDTYRRAIHRACTKAGIEKWSPNRLRHTAATLIRKQFGLEAAQVILGHSTADVTQIYAERDLEKAIEVAERIG